MRIFVGGIVVFKIDKVVNMFVKAFDCLTYSDKPTKYYFVKSPLDKEMLRIRSMCNGGW
jgi:hypothetical protein